MGFLFDLLFGDEQSGGQNTEQKKKPGDDFYHHTCEEEDYYEDLSGDAFLGDESAIREMEETFGEDWKDDFE